MKNLLLSACLLVLGSAPASFAQPDEARAAAARTLQDFAGRVSASNARSLGFQGPEEASTGTLGEPIPVFMVSLERLQRYQGEDPGRLLLDLQRVVYPVQVEGEVRSLVEVQSTRGRWETVQIGGAQKSRLMEKHRRGVMRTAGARVSDFFELRVPALHLVFLAHHGAEGLVVTPLLDEASLGLRAGQPELASQVFSRLAPRARETPLLVP
ncbi:hypothetical protein CYFUS_005682 [Cystobacter fuscus]|uniref:Lipoprotein n=1 Tax=Cystobacter fuscus TaxID=43 RepID=A0A250J8L6_9BACT|nr:hypothetical protein [Cystobacter fuscus]ATB40234.1 hypothetical protein CYFUS_005682 [Cystobacter fuscus]